MSWEKRNQKRRELQKKKAKFRDFTKCELQDLCEENGYKVQNLTEYQIRIEGKLDIYPTSRKYHLLTKNERGEIHELEVDIIRLLNKK